MTGNLLKEELKSNSVLMKGVEARSMEAVGLQTRDFNRKNGIEEVVRINQGIRDLLDKCRVYLEGIKVSNGNLTDKLETV